MWAEVLGYCLGFAPARSKPNASSSATGFTPAPKICTAHMVVFKAHRLLYHSTLGMREIKKKKTWSSGTLRYVRLWDLLSSEYSTYKTVRARFGP